MNDCNLNILPGVDVDLLHPVLFLCTRLHTEALHEIYSAFHCITSSIYLLFKGHGIETTLHFNQSMMTHAYQSWQAQMNSQRPEHGMKQSKKLNEQRCVFLCTLCAVRSALLTGSWLAHWHTQIGDRWRDVVTIVVLFDWTCTLRGKSVCVPSLNVKLCLGWERVILYVYDMVLGWDGSSSWCLSGVDYITTVWAWHQA